MLVESNRLGRQIRLQDADPAFLRIRRPDRRGRRAPELLQSALQHLGAADHVLEGGHGVLPLRLFVGDRRVEAVAAGLRDQHRRLGRVAARRRGIVQPAQQRRRRHDGHHQVLAVANRQHQSQHANAQSASWNGIPIRRDSFCVGTDVCTMLRSHRRGCFEADTGCARRARDWRPHPRSLTIRGRRIPNGDSQVNGSFCRPTKDGPGPILATMLAKWVDLLIGMVLSVGPGQTSRNVTPPKNAPHCNGGG